ncbi:agmatine deiminase family protein [Prevotella ihumii]|uniref:agmatine deiminase family protein n=1 Tax=Prevotella ihumii TaxID=1917878 RepID=UPI0009818D41|nr:agmatine deiminase family protein [Prevotella ihumii]
MQNTFRFPAEWEKQSGIMLIWPHKDTDWYPYLKEITETYLQLAEVITRYEKLLIVAQELEAVKELIYNRLSNEQIGNVIFRQCENNDTWARDVAPITLIPQTANKETKMPFHLMDFCFNGWGEKFAADKDNRINRQLYFEDTFCGVLENHKDFVLEGGSIESDGKQTLFTTTACLTAPHRNEPLTKDNLEKRLLQLFPNMKRVVWIEHGELQGDDTDGHVDTILRCAPNDTLLYISTDNTADPHFEDLRALDEQVQSLRTLEGKPYRLFKLPIPEAIYDEGERLPATYANFLILNGAVIVPTYNQPKYDKQALATIQEAFPDYDIIGIDSVTIVRQHGSIHCLTMQFPEGVI